MLTRIAHNIKTPDGAPVVADGLGPTTIFAGPNETGKTAATQAVKLVCEAQAHDVRGRTSSGVKLLGDLGGASNELRVEAEDDGGSRRRWRIRTGSDGTFSGKPEVIGDSAYLPVMDEVMAIGLAGEDAAIGLTASSVGWLQLWQKYVGGELPARDPESYPNAVVETVARAANFRAKVKSHKDTLENLSVAHAAGAPELSERIDNAKRDLAAMEAELKIELAHALAVVWPEVRKRICAELRGQSRVWAELLYDRRSGQDRYVEVDAQGRLQLGGRVVLSGAGVWLARLVAAYALSRWARHEGAKVVVAIEDSPFDADRLRVWPADLRDSTSGFQVFITMPLRNASSLELDDLPEGISVVYTPLLNGGW